MTQAPSIDTSRRLFAGDFPELQARFIAEVSATRAQDPLAPLVVLVPGHLAGLYLRRELARAGTSHANIRFHTLTDFARERAEPLLVERGLRMLPEVARGPLMKRAVETCGPLHNFFRMAGRTGFRSAASSTIHELRAAGLTPEDLEAAAKHPQMDRVLRAKLADLVAIWRAFDRLMQRHQFTDRAALLDLASLATTSGCGFVIYGLDDLSAMERRVLEIVMCDVPVTAFLPFRASDAYAWAEPLYVWYLDQGFEAELLDSDKRESRGTTLSRIQTGVFENDSPPPTGGHGGAKDEPDSSFLVISAPSRDSEVEEILREVLYPPFISADAHPTRRAVLMRESANYLNLFREECRRAEITGYFHECRRLRETSSGRALRWLAKLFDGVFRRSDVMEFLLSSPLRRPNNLPADLPEVPAAEWNHFSLQARIIAGEKSWKENLARLRNRLTSELERREWEADDPTAPIRKQLESLGAFGNYLQRFFAGVHGVREAKSWRQLGERVSALYSELVESDGESEVIREELAHTELFDLLGLKPDPEEFSSFLESLLATPLPRDGRFEVHEPAVAKISEALGVIFDEVLLCGLVEKEFPRPAAQDPLLLDDERRQLQHALFLSHPDLQIPLRARQRLREQFLFRVALNSATQRVVLTYPRLDPVEGREWLASAFLLRAVEAATGEPADYESLERFVRTRPQARRVSINRLRSRDADRSVTPFQYDLSRLGSALQGNSADDVAYLFCADAQFRRGVEAERHRYRERRFTPFDGCVENDALRRRLAEWVPQLSPARMDRYVNCPFQYFVFHLLELEPSVEPQWIQPLEPHARGGLLHVILEQFYRRERDTGNLPLKPDAWPRLEQTAHECFAAFEREQVPGLFLLWDIERNRMLKRLRAFFSTEVEQASEFRPRYFNVDYGLPDGDAELSRAEPVAVKLDNGFVVQLRGKLDRVDVNATDTARLVDYTTRNFDRFRKKNSTPTLESYAARLAAEALGLKVDSFSYYFLATDETQSLDFSRESWEQCRANLMQLMEFVSGNVANGAFFPHPTDGCRFCEARSACGSGRFTHKWEFDLPQTESFRLLYGGDS